MVWMAAEDGAKVRCHVQIQRLVVKDTCQMSSRGEVMQRRKTSRFLKEWRSSSACRSRTPDDVSSPIRTFAPMK